MYLEVKLLEQQPLIFVDILEGDYLRVNFGVTVHDFSTEGKIECNIVNNKRVNIQLPHMSPWSLLTVVVLHKKTKHKT